MRTITRPQPPSAEPPAVSRREPFAGDILTHFPPGYTPRPQQAEAIRRIAEAFASGKRVVVLELPTGGGKSHITQTFARAQRAAGGASHFLTAQRILQDQYEKDFPAPEIEIVKGRANYPCSHPSAGPSDDAAHAPCTRRGKGILPFCCTDPENGPSAVVRLNARPEETSCPYWKQLITASRAPVTLFNFSSFLFQQRIGRFGKRDLMIVDECFPAGTKVLTPNGEKSIEFVRCGDIVYNAGGIGIVGGVSAKPSEDLYEITFSGGTRLTATGNHPIFTNEGWRPVRALGPGGFAYGIQAVRSLWKTVRPTQMAINAVAGRMGGRGLFKLEQTRNLLKILCEEIAEPHAPKRSSGQDIRNPKTYSASTYQTRREWAIASLTAACTPSCVGGGMGSGGLGANPEKAGARLANLLQNRCGEQGKTDRNRDRGGPANVEKAKTDGTEATPSHLLRVVSVRHLKSTGPRTVYNLRVGGHPSYFANGVLVHNCHNIESQLLSYVEMSVSDRQLDPVNAAVPAGLETPAAVADWIRGGLLERIEEAAGDEDRPIEERDALQKLALKLEIFLEYLERTEWILETAENRDGFRTLTARPVYAFDFADDLLFSKAGRVLAVSATILDAEIWAVNLGLDPKEVAFIQMGSDFPVANRPIRREYAGDMSYKHKDETIPRLVAWIRDVLLPRHAGQRGIIHAHSFALAQAIVRGVGSPRLLLHEGGQDKREVLKVHAAREDSVIVAPAFHEGIDLKDDLSRFQVIAKAPYPSIADPVIKRRMETESGRLFYSWLTMLKFVQSYGRSVRSKEDWAVTYLTDSGFEGLLNRATRFIPVWVKEAIIPKA